MTEIIYICTRSSTVKSISGFIKPNREASKLIETHRNYIKIVSEVIETHQTISVVKSPVHIMFRTSIFKSNHIKLGT